MAGKRVVLLWATNRGVQMIVNTGLAQMQLEAVFCTSLGQFQENLQRQPVAVLVASEELRSSGIDVAALVSLVGDGPIVVILNSSRQPIDSMGTRARPLAIPCTSKQLVQVLSGAVQSAEDSQQKSPETTPIVHDPLENQSLDTQNLNELIAEEVDKQLKQLIQTKLDSLIQRLVPEMAEAIIKQELERLLSEAQANAPLDLGPDSGDV
ncbi:MAG: hypothetical protein ACOX51_07350 [Myxococcota bacterium]|nr:hypothetical protein [Myxococcota bacterium]MBP8970227.1 hypothetical protein [Myxococcota bacterium]HHW96344.1 hypothetical protein [Oligoflexales bacterium]HQC45314.1 hypothetical protein [Myxococcota bacterium]HQL56609.1 hypothetical protein [Myxococcota bacterium]